jgi:hypothetical protein
MASELVKYDVSQLMTLGQVIAKSGLFQDARQEAQAVVKVLAGAELGIPPIASMTGVYVVKGRVTLSANLIAAVIKRSGRYSYRVIRLNNETCEIEFFEGSESIGTSTFTMADAQQAGLGGDNWRKYPRNMLFARALSNGAKWFTPDVFGGPIYTPDELGQTVDGETGEAIDVEVASYTEDEEQVEGYANGHELVLGPIMADQAALDSIVDLYRNLYPKVDATDNMILKNLVAKANGGDTALTADNASRAFDMLRAKAMREAR